ncbi:MAG: SDR family NAD(P)-dependent oxidoreductase [Chloroflexi bacterium]|nr:MAG: SDR family NAD(P)-dependent oxidoreductase [Chloroflexota bacterium]
MSHLTKKVVIVTGATAGIGRETAVLLTKAGATVMATGRRNQRLTALETDCARHPGTIKTMAGDIGSESFARELVTETIAAFGKLDVLVNNAGVGHKSELAEMPMADMKRIFDTNIYGLMYATQVAVAQMKQQGFGQIVNVSSIVGQSPLPASGAYCASKTAVNFLSRALRMELLPHNIKVTLVYPGLTETEFSDATLGGKGRNRFGLKGVPAARVGQAIVRGIEKEKPEIYITPTDWLLTHFNRLFPRTLDFVLGRMGGLT